MFGQDGNTPLHYACREGDVDITQVLLSRGADITIKNKNGKNPLDECQKANRHIIKNLLAEYNPKRG